MSVQLKSILDQLEESKNRGKNFIKYYDLIDFETIKKLKDLGRIDIEMLPYKK